MRLEELKARVHELVDSATSEERLRMAEHDLQGIENIPFVAPEHEAGILRGIQEIKDGFGIPVEQVIAELKARRDRRDA